MTSLILRHVWFVIYGTLMASVCICSAKGQEHSITNNPRVYELTNGPYTLKLDAQPAPEFGIGGYHRFSLNTAHLGMLEIRFHSDHTVDCIAILNERSPGDQWGNRIGEASGIESSFIRVMVHPGSVYELSLCSMWGGTVELMFTQISKEVSLPIEPDALSGRFEIYHQMNEDSESPFDGIKQSRHRILCAKHSWFEAELFSQDLAAELKVEFFDHNSSLPKSRWSSSVDSSGRIRLRVPILSAPSAVFTISTTAQDLKYRLEGRVIKEESVLKPYIMSIGQTLLLQGQHDDESFYWGKSTFEEWQHIKVPIDGILTFQRVDEPDHLGAENRSSMSLVRFDPETGRTEWGIGESTSNPGVLKYRVKSGEIYRLVCLAEIAGEWAVNVTLDAVKPAQETYIQQGSIRSEFPVKWDGVLGFQSGVNAEGYLENIHRFQIDSDNEMFLQFISDFGDDIHVDLVSIDSDGYKVMNTFSEAEIEHEEQYQAHSFAHLEADQEYGIRIRSRRPSREVMSENKYSLVLTAVADQKTVRNVEGGWKPQFRYPLVELGSTGVLSKEGELLAMRGPGGIHLYSIASRLPIGIIPDAFDPQFVWNEEVLLCNRNGKKVAVWLNEPKPGYPLEPIEGSMFFELDLPKLFRGAVPISWDSSIDSTVLWGKENRRVILQTDSDRIAVVDVNDNGKSQRKLTLNLDPSEVDQIEHMVIAPNDSAFSFVVHQSNDERSVWSVSIDRRQVWKVPVHAYEEDNSALSMSALYVSNSGHHLAVSWYGEDGSQWIDWYKASLLNTEDVQLVHRLKLENSQSVYGFRESDHTSLMVESIVDIDELNEWIRLDVVHADGKVTKGVYDLGGALYLSKDYQRDRLEIRKKGVIEPVTVLSDSRDGVQPVQVWSISGDGRVIQFFNQKWKTEMSLYSLDLADLQTKHVERMFQASPHEHQASPEDREKAVEFGFDEEWAESKNIEILGLVASRRWLVTQGEFGEIVYWNTDTKEIDFSIGIDAQHHATAMLPDGRFAGPRRLDHMLCMNNGNVISPISSFDANLNRPGEVIESIGFAHSTRVNALKGARVRRIERLGYSTSSVKSVPLDPAPVIQPSPPMKIDTETITVPFQVKDSQVGGRILASVNGLPATGRLGIEITQRTNELSVDLGVGLNIIELWVEREVGLRSLSSRVVVDCQATFQLPKTYFLGIGVSEYQDQSRNLSYPAKDVQDLDFALQSISRGKYESLILVDDEANVEQIVKARSFLEKARVTDRVFVLFSGHGILTDSGEYRFATQDTDFQNPDESGLRFEQIENLVGWLATSQLNVFLDTCHAGELEHQSKIHHQLDNGVVNKSGQTKGLQDDEQELYDHAFSTRITELFTDLRNGSGATIYAASSGEEYAYEFDSIQNGVFSRTLIDAITTGLADKDSNGVIQDEELRAFLVKRVTELTRGGQKPEIIRDSSSGMTNVTSQLDTVRKREIKLKRSEDWFGVVDVRTSSEGQQTALLLRSKHGSGDEYAVVWVDFHTGEIVSDHIGSDKHRFVNSARVGLNIYDMCLDGTTVILDNGLVVDLDHGVLSTPKNAGSMPVVSKNGRFVVYCSESESSEFIVLDLETDAHEPHRISVFDEVPDDYHFMWESASAHPEHPSIVRMISEGYIIDFNPETQRIVGGGPLPWAKYQFDDYAAYLKNRKSKPYQVDYTSVQLSYTGEHAFYVVTQVPPGKESWQFEQTNRREVASIESDGTSELITLNESFVIDSEFQYSDSLVLKENHIRPLTHVVRSKSSYFDLQSNDEGKVDERIISGDLVLRFEPAGLTDNARWVFTEIHTDKAVGWWVAPTIYSHLIHPDGQGGFVYADFNTVMSFRPQSHVNN